jgi:DNA polymerase III epsilon subunit-like protein
MNKELLRFQKNLKYIIFDFETCNLNLLQDNNPWQLSFSVNEGDKTVEEFDLFPFWDPLGMEKEAAKITRFNYDLYKKKSSDAKKCLDLFERFVYNPEYLLVGHNILGFDVYIHQIFRRNLGLKTDFSFIHRCVDTNLLSKSYKLQMLPDKENFLAWQYRLNSIIRKGLKTNLSFIAKEFGIGFDKNRLHDGLYDIFINKQVFLKLIQTVDV